MFNCGFSFTKDQIWTRPSKCSQNRYSDVENSFYQPSACLLLQDFVYSIESLYYFAHFQAEKLCGYEEKIGLSLYL